ncbi:TPA_asm: hypothetical protein vir520_00017 [Caudoviricetes sp. vir520]|nr:TPA_asm: hypothetical protein vir520_00017 [Caudoviricetes sp. vir520]
MWHRIKQWWPRREYPCAFFEECGPLWLREKYEQGINTPCIEVTDDTTIHYLVIKIYDTELNILKSLSGTEDPKQISNFITSLIYDKFQRGK